VKLTGGFY